MSLTLGDGCENTLRSLQKIIRPKICYLNNYVKILKFITFFLMFLKTEGVICLAEYSDIIHCEIVQKEKSPSWKF